MWALFDRESPDGEESPDQYERAVASVINALLDGSDFEVKYAFAQLEGLSAIDIICELFIWVEDVTEGIALDTLITAVRIPLPPNAREIIGAIYARDMRLLEEMTSKDDPNVVVSKIINLIVSLKDAREQLDKAAN